MRLDEAMQTANVARNVNLVVRRIAWANWAARGEVYVAGVDGVLVAREDTLIGLVFALPGVLRDVAASDTGWIVE